MFKPPTTSPRITDLPLYWFARLERAVEEGDHQAAAQAQQRLEHLGVQVRYGRPRDVEGGRSDVV